MNIKQIFCIGYNGVKTFTNSSSPTSDKYKGRNYWLKSLGKPWKTPLFCDKCHRPREGGEGGPDTQKNQNPFLAI